MRTSSCYLATLLFLVAWNAAQAADEPDGTSAGLTTGQFAWTVSGQVFAPIESDEDLYYSIKDPSIVHHGGHWHLFCTIRGRERSHQVEYLTFEDWARPETARRQMLSLHGQGYFCAPQVFFFEPHNRWYLICQASHDSWEPNYGASFSTTRDLSDPESWSPLQPLGARQANGKSGLDFWVICDDTKAHLFFTTLDGRMWREETSLDEFPHGWSEPVLAIQGDIFEASHTYRLRGMKQYLTVIEAQHGHGWRYFKAYLADRLDGPWTPLAATKNQAFASMANTEHPSPQWTDNISHGELLRAGCDQRLEVDPANLRFLFQGVAKADRAGKPYGQIPWRLGLLTPSPAN